eukprot:scaffold347763_cov18-Prasinocladus_malaysianus.AAC.1
MLYKLPSGSSGDEQSNLLTVLGMLHNNQHGIGEALCDLSDKLIMRVKQDISDSSSKAEVGENEIVWCSMGLLWPGRQGAQAAHLAMIADAEQIQLKYCQVDCRLQE